MPTRTWRYAIAVAIAVAGNLSLIPLRAAWCGPAPDNLWCLTLAFTGPWQVVLLATGVAVGLLVGARWGFLILVAANLVGFALLLSIDPWAVTEQAWSRVGPMSFLNSLVTGLPAPVVGLAAGAGIRWAVAHRRQPADAVRW